MKCVNNHIQIEQLSQNDALEIAQVWKYPQPYDFYDMTADIEDYEEIINPDMRADNYFSFKEKGVLIGFFCIDSFENKSDEIEFGIGLRPDLTGKNLGQNYVQVVIDYLKKNRKPNKIWLSVADFNQRVIKVYKRVGFSHQYGKKQKTNGSEYDFIVMSMDILE